MKEATGELNMTVVVVLAVACLSAFFFSVIWPMIRSNFTYKSKCDAAICDKVPNDDGKMVTCHEKGNESNTFSCPWKG